MATNKTSRDVMVVVAVVAAVAMTILANLLADRKFSRLDLTQEGRYSLSKSFHTIVDRLDDPATITYYVSTQVPSNWMNYRRDIIDKLKEIENAGHGNIKLSVVDPSENKELAERLRQLKAELEAPDIQKDSYSVMRVFTCLEITYKDKPKKFIQKVVSPEELEYVIGSTLVELTMKKKPIIAVKAPPSPPNRPQMPGMEGPEGSGYEWITMQQNQWDDAMKFDLRNIDLTEGNTVPDDTSLLVLIRPKELNERQKYEVVKYLAGGGNVLLLASPFKVNHDGMWRAEQAATGLEGYLKEAGITFGADFVLDNSNIQLPYGFDPKTGQVLAAKLPMFVRILPDNVNQECALTRLMPGLVMPSPAEIKLLPDVLKKNEIKATVLARTSKQSWSIGYMEVINPRDMSQYDEATQVYEGQKNVFTMLEGQFPFPYEGKPEPDWKKTAEPQPASAKPPAQASVNKKAGRLILCSAPETFHATYIKNPQLGTQGNWRLLVNIAESVSMGDELITLRTKSYETRAIDKLAGPENDAKRAALKFLLIIGVPLLVVCIALVRMALRRNTQSRYERKFASTIGPSSFTP